MKLMAIIVAALVVPGAAGAGPPSKQRIFCSELRRVLEVAEHDGDFTYLERSRAAPPRFGFRHGCQATGDERRQFWICSQSLAPEEMSRDALARRIAECLPEAVRGRNGITRDAVFTLPHARIRITELGGPKAKAGRIVELVVESMLAR